MKNSWLDVAVEKPLFFSTSLDASQTKCFRRFDDCGYHADKVQVP
jgi:hypothetical protein